MKILDSDHCIAVLRGQLDLRHYISSNEELAITSISIGELTHGAHKSRNVALSLSQLDVLFAALVPVSFDEYAAHHFGQLKAYLEQQGQRLADLDLQIASIALHHHAVLVTHNQRHFSRVDFLQLDDWLA